MDDELSRINLKRHSLTWDSKLHTCIDVQYLAVILVVIVELQRRIDKVLGVPQTTVYEATKGGMIEEVCLVNDEQVAQLKKSLYKKEIDKMAILLHGWLNTHGSFEDVTIVRADMELFNIGESNIAQIKVYKKELESRVKQIRNSKEYQWFLKDGKIIGSWE